MSKLKIKVEHGLAIHQNFWTWNSFHLGLKLSQGVVVCYFISVLLANMWTYFWRNQTNIWFDYAPSEIENYLSLLKKENSLEEDGDGLVIW